ncbi:hypothetical protein FFI97_022250 [Variovorax sp. KBS0712]|uniref:Bug family tripartite tricarboxylate transporter substrate binding protein n=1 Tax=Variovorax sp. KBS0712 TaxID=2578111 RepID=UPI00111BA287|nr:tripartite tricarboxylate transporter substrate-binding protein [Variovorax sp. KBS0712]TSD56902.1 hypothetical protein FFI97_022250 [Variovorax sp. KBS0712]
MERRTALQALAAAGLASMGAARASEAQPLNLLVGFAAGSVPDLVARVISRPLTQALGRTTIVENKGGAGGQLALAALKQHSAVAQQLAITPVAALSLYPLTYARLPYDPERDFVPVCSICVIDFALVVAADHPAQTLQEFVAWCKRNPGKASIGNPGSGSSPHFVATLFGTVAGIQVEHVPYRAPPQIAQEVIGGTLSAGMASVPLFSELIKSGRLRVLATSGAQRNPFYPHIPTFSEVGYPGVVGQEWFALYAPAGASPDLVAALGRAVLQAVGRDDVKAVLTPLGLSLDVRDAVWLAERRREESAQWRAVVQRTGFKAQ